MGKPVADEGFTVVLNARGESHACNWRTLGILIRANHRRSQNDLDERAPSIPAWRTRTRWSLIGLNGDAAVRQIRFGDCGGVFFSDVFARLHAIIVSTRRSLYSQNYRKLKVSPRHVARHPL
jgi:hypothetical protein